MRASGQDAHRPGQAPGAAGPGRRPRPTARPPTARTRTGTSRAAGGPRARAAPSTAPTARARPAPRASSRRRAAARPGAASGPRPHCRPATRASATPRTRTGVCGERERQRGQGQGGGRRMGGVAQDEARGARQRAPRWWRGRSPAVPPRARRGRWARAGARRAGRRPRPRRGWRTQRGGRPLPRERWAEQEPRRHQGEARARGLGGAGQEQQRDRDREPGRAARVPPRATWASAASRTSGSSGAATSVAVSSRCPTR